MKAVRVHTYGKRPSVDEVPEPTVGGPFDVLVEIGAAGLCRTDLHIIEGPGNPRARGEVRGDLHKRAARAAPGSG